MAHLHARLGIGQVVVGEQQVKLWHGAPARGHLPASVAERLTTGLRRHTGTPDDCWFGIWAGWGALVADGPTERVMGDTELMEQHGLGVD